MSTRWGRSTLPPHRIPHHLRPYRQQIPEMDLRKPFWIRPPKLLSMIRLGTIHPSSPIMRSVQSCVEVSHAILYPIAMTHTPFQSMGLVLILVGLGVVGMGVLLLVLGAIGGRLPLDFIYQGDRVTIWIPLGTSLLLSLLLTVLLNLVFLFLRSR